jgi:hypothetical protein
MAQQAYIRLTDDQYWGIAVGDGIEETVTFVAVGRPFTPGADIWEAVAELEAWAQDNGYVLTTGYTVEENWSLQDLIEPEIFDEVFGEGANAEDKP